MSALAHQTTENQPGVTSISVNARVDYILRFSKQAVLVVDEDSNTYSRVGSLLLGALPDDHNAAFVSIAAKLNDIQIRSRIVEQLFGGALFDPEQALTGSIIKLASEKRETISIIIEHAHLLSLQLLHELCQLAEIAKKTKLDINVVMLGQHQAGKLVAANKMLFTNKLSILSAATGQLLSLDAGVFKEAQSFFALTFGKKAALGFTVLLIISALVITWLYQRDSLSFSDLPQQQSITIPDGADVFVQDLSAAKEASAGKEPSATAESATPAYATNADIYQALLAPEAAIQIGKEDKIPEQARPSDVFNAVILADKPVKAEQTEVKVNSEVAAPVKAADNAVPVSQSDKVSVTSGVNPDYFLQTKQGFVIQLAGFSYPSVFKEFIADHEQLEYFGYYRQLNGQKLLVITSRVYDSRDEALQARESLPESVKQRGPWIKSVAAVNNEINAFQSSQ
ncbi:SPOR domain-containing protein [Thalassomonas actiniarum]|uniref:SPOR domain-containing protein n=1 Tax=Thalassomonas actiniarum TaxID=485447 RepID=A0AAF0C499_9GAMM|nr:SPOR domain-containing protein [Thalassomonas actiniarum]WDD99713.1 SPOR domain-containing protein [Thalassomonas actiniarum]